MYVISRTELKPSPSDLAQKGKSSISYGCCYCVSTKTNVAFTKVVIEGELVIVPNLKD